MVQELFTNFATTTLSTPNPLTSGGLSFTVATGQGSLFPLANFCVTIDTEILFIASRSGDTFTVATGGRGWDGTTATSHTGGGSATVQLSVSAFNLNHLWQNIADTFTPEVPPAQATLGSNGVPSGSAGTYDSEFESAGGWTLAPSPSGGTVFDIGSVVRSHLTFNRTGSDLATYTAYISTSLTNTSVFTLTAKVSQGTSYAGSSGDLAEVQLFACDQSNPSSSFDSGNRFRLLLKDSPSTSFSSSTPQRTVRAAKAVSGTNTDFSPTVSLSAMSPVWLRITYDGAGNYRGFFSGDGLTYWALLGQSGFGFTPHTIGFAFKVNTSSFLGQQVVIDYLRYSSSTLPPYGS